MQNTVTKLINRDLSILAFNQRVLSLSRRKDIPLLERLRFLCITSSNLDEFFEVRGAQYLLTAPSDEDKAISQSVSGLAHELVSEQYRIYQDELNQELRRSGIRIVNHKDRTKAQKKWVKNLFNALVRPLLIPVSLDPAHPFPKVANKSLNFIIQLAGKNAFGRNNDIAILKVPRVLPRMISMPLPLCANNEQLFVALSSVIRAHLGELFNGRKVVSFSQFRVTRHSDLALDEEDVVNLRTALRQGLELRPYGQAVRLEVSKDCTSELTSFLLRQFKLTERDLYRVNGPVNLVRTSQIIDLIDAPHLLYPAYKPVWPQSLLPRVSIFEQLKMGDHLIHHPYQSFDAIIVFLREAALDEAVMAIKLTIYRTESNSELIIVLRDAIKRGKEVTVVLELKARFDEEANISWAEMLESAGAQVVYGVVGLKTHVKMLLVTRMENKRLVRYGHLSTGNYNAKTATMYTDLSYLTAQEPFVSDMDHLFLHLASQVKLPRLQKLWCAPFQLHKQLLLLIGQIASKATKGESCSIVLKLNALTDEPLIAALLKAGQQGVKIDLIVRGACMLPAQRKGFSENITVRSIVGRFLEHTRIFYFRAGQQTQVFLSSADWMSRNMMRRVEIAWPVTDEGLKQRIIDECLVSSLYDTVDAWEMNAAGTYERIAETGTVTPASMQQALLTLYEV